MDLGALYEEVILDHNRSPRNWGELPGARHIEGRNPLCGDKISLAVMVDGDVVTDIKFPSEGCAISNEGVNTALAMGTNASGILYPVLVPMVATMLSADEVNSSV